MKETDISYYSHHYISKTIGLQRLQNAFSFSFYKSNHVSRKHIGDSILYLKARPSSHPSDVIWLNLLLRPILSLFLGPNCNVRDHFLS